MLPYSDIAVGGDLVLDTIGDQGDMNWELKVCTHNDDRFDTSRHARYFIFISFSFSAGNFERAIRCDR
jgi:hypothetical protein